MFPTAISFGEESPPAQEHAYRSWDVVLQPTETTEGLMVSSCESPCSHLLYRSIPCPGSAEALCVEWEVGSVAPLSAVLTPSASLSGLFSAEELAAATAENPATARVTAEPITPVDSSGQVDPDYQQFLVLGAVQLGEGATSFPFDISLRIQPPGAAAPVLVSELPEGMSIALELRIPSFALKPADFNGTHKLLLAHLHSGAAPDVIDLSEHEGNAVQITLTRFSSFAFIWKSTPASNVEPEPAPEPPASSDPEPAPAPDPEPELSSPPVIAEPDPPVTEGSTAPDEPLPEDPTPEETPVEAADSSTPTPSTDPFFVWSPKQTAHSIRLRWTPVEGADGYLILASRCSTRKVARAVKPVVTLGPDARTWVQRGLHKGEWYKFRVAAFALDEHGQRVELKRSGPVHAATLGGSSRTAQGVQITGMFGEGGEQLALQNPEETALVTSGNAGDPAALPFGSLPILELQAGQRIALTARELGSKLTVHHRGLRFISSNARVLKVNSRTGCAEVTGSGTCRLWVTAQSGVWQMLDVRVA